MNTSSIKRELLDVLLDQIQVDEHQPRSDFPDSPENELTASLAKDGQIEPLLLYRNGDGFVPVSGARRVISGRKVGLKTMFAIVLDQKPDPSELFLHQLLANTHRLDLNPMELCLAYTLIIETMKINASELAKTVSKSKTYVSNILSLDSLPVEIQRLVREGKIGLAKAALLARMNLEEQSNAVESIITGNMKRQNLEKLAARKKSDGEPIRRVTIEMPSATLNLIAKAKISVDEVIELLQSVVRECKKARSQGLDVATLSSICRDRAKLKAEVTPA